MRGLGWRCVPQVQISVFCERKKKHFALSPGLEVLTACPEHITHCVIGLKSEKVVPTAHRNVSLESQLAVLGGGGEMV